MHNLFIPILKEEGQDETELAKAFADAQESLFSVELSLSKKFHNMKCQIISEKIKEKHDLEFDSIETLVESGFLTGESKGNNEVWKIGGLHLVTFVATETFSDVSEDGNFRCEMKLILHYY